ncbi:MAG: hypothetical protein J6Y02_23875 [Pseudobutyrivibrio sp.]|nr:hypothetical protein [Pseudobutyrivibrio sp.]
MTFEKFAKYIMMTTMLFIKIKGADGEPDKTFYEGRFGEMKLMDYCFLKDFIVSDYTNFEDVLNPRMEVIVCL